MPSSSETPNSTDDYNEYASSFQQPNSSHALGAFQSSKYSRVSFVQYHFKIL